MDKIASVRDEEIRKLQKRAKRWRDAAKGLRLDVKQLDEYSEGLFESCVAFIELVEELEGKVRQLEAMLQDKVGTGSNAGADC